MNIYRLNKKLKEKISFLKIQRLIWQQNGGLIPVERYWWHDQGGGRGGGSRAVAMGTETTSLVKLDFIGLVTPRGGK